MEYLSSEYQRLIMKQADAMLRNGLKQTVDHIHALGFKAGIYSDAGRNACGSFWDKDSLGINVGFYGHDRQDADYFFKEIGFDFIKIDFCGGDAKQNFDQFFAATEKRGTDSVKSRRTRLASLCR